MPGNVASWWQTAAQRDRVPDRVVGRVAVDAGDDVHRDRGRSRAAAAIGAIVVVKRDGTRVLANVERDPLATPPDDDEPEATG